LGAVNDGNVVPFALGCGFDGDPCQSVDARPRSIVVPSGNASLGIHQKHFVNTELGGHAHAVVELRAFGNGEHQDDARVARLAKRRFVRSAHDLVSHGLESSSRSATLPVEEDDLVAGLKAQDTHVTTRRLCEDDLPTLLG